jgi:elongation factor G
MTVYVIEFYLEVERALRVLDGAILVLCGVSGVQSQTLTVDRQMKRYNIPRIAFINKLDRMGANPWKVLDGLRVQLKLPATAVQIPIGLDSNFEGVVDIINREAFHFNGVKGTEITTSPVPTSLVEECEEKRKELIERLAEVDDDIAELFISEIEPSPEQIRTAIRKQTIARKFVPVFMGSAFKNKGVQKLLDGVIDYLPAPTEVESIAFDLDNNEAETKLTCDPKAPLVALAFKLQESRFGQLSYLRIYQGILRRGEMVVNVVSGKKVKLPRLVRMHSSEMEDVEEAGAGDVVACFGVECASMDTFTDGTVNLAMKSMFVPAAVMSISVKPKTSAMMTNFSKAVGKFSREDPTLRVTLDDKTQETIMSGMGELHLDIYVERMKREYGVECITGKPSVNFKETILQKSGFNYLHKKQSGGAGQFARVVGYIEPLEEELIKKGIDFEFENGVVGTNVSLQLIFLLWITPVGNVDLMCIDSSRIHSELPKGRQGGL